MAKVYAPNKQYSGLSAGVMFTQGVGETDNTTLIDWFISKGYTVDEVAATPDAEIAMRSQIAGLGLISPEAYSLLFAEKEALQTRVIDLEQALEIANGEIERLSQPPPAATAEPDAPIEPTEKEAIAALKAAIEPAKPARKGK